MQLPETFLEQMKLLLGTDYECMARRSYDKKPLAGLRFNTVKTYTDEWEGMLSPFALRRVAWTKKRLLYRRGCKGIPPSLLLCRSLLSSGTKCHGTCGCFTGLSG